MQGAKTAIKLMRSTKTRSPSPLRGQKRAFGPSPLGKAKYIKSLTGWTGHASLYELDPPLRGHKYVIVSATFVPFDNGPETYIFPAFKNGKPKDMMELPGSFKGELDQEKALRNAGYKRVLDEAHLKKPGA